jgi:hypothetical protein
VNCGAREQSDKQACVSRENDSGNLSIWLHDWLHSRQL